MTAGANPRLGPNGRAIRSFVLPDSLGGRLRVWRFIIYRRLFQFTVLLLFFGTAHWAWSIGETPILIGNLSGSTLLGLIPMADPFAVAQILSTGATLERDVLLGAGIVLFVYALIGGRVWCSWVCPINLVTDLAGWLRRRLGVGDMFRIKRSTRYTVLVLALLLSALSGVAAFEWVSPISMFHRELIFGAGLGWTAVLGVFLFDLLIVRHGWCGHLCPLGAFYALVGKFASIRVRFNSPTCTHCGDCAKICPEPQVLDLKTAALAGWISSGECTNCGRCVTVCPEDTLKFDLRSLINTNIQPTHLNPSERSTT